FLARLRTTPEKFFMLMKSSWATEGWVIEGGDHTNSTPKFYDSLVRMQMAMNRGEINEMILPDFVADYLMRVSKSYARSCVSSSGKMGLCFGFTKDNKALADQWNNALSYLRNNWKLAELEKKYIKEFPRDDQYDYVYGIDQRRRDQKKRQDRITFEKFPGAPTVRVAVTGDLPPADFISEEGLPAGYSVAVLSEIGKLLKVNIVTVSVSAGARTAALVSGRADVVFWYEVNKQSNIQPDVPDDVLLSDPYLEWNTFYHLSSAE
ncbi:MAG: transporter substrate-binding domain-containing protein, partial [Synergistaceae bacterium]|nr:transporter substrate-binding domain-containing protein [Synergistaceae bacterium]